MSRRLHIAVFEDERSLLAAGAACRDAGLEMIDAYTPYPVHGLDEVIGIRRTRLPWICLIGGVLGVSCGLLLQYWASAVDWPLNVGGKPWDSLPAFVPVTFEMLVLFAGLATAFGLWLRSGLLPGRSPRRRFERVLDDRFALVVAHRGAGIEPGRVDDMLRENGAIECRQELEDLP